MKYVKFFLIFLFLLNLTTSITQCGISKPSEENDCFSYSTDTNSCCYYSYFDKKGCILYNGLHNGETNYGGLLVTCSSSFTYLSYSLSLLLLFIVLN